MVAQTVLTALFPVLYLALGSVVGSLSMWKLLKERSLALIWSSGPLLASVLIVATAHWGFSRPASVALLTVVAVLLLRSKTDVQPRWEPLSKWQGFILGGLGTLVLAFTYVHSIYILDTDRYLHDLHISAFSRGVYPPVNPFFPDLAMNGHFGRDLFMAMLHRTGDDPIVVTWWVTPIIQAATFFFLFASTQRVTGSAVRGLFVACTVFLGMNVGFRVGLIDTYEGSNGLAHPWLILLMYLMVKLQESPDVRTVLLSGFVLGTYQLVYMTSFALLLLTGLVLYICKVRSRQAWLALVVTGFLAMGLAVTEGGAFTDLARRGADPKMETTLQNQGLRVSLQFPKEHLFQVMSSRAEYLAVSVAYKTPLFRFIKPEIRTDGYKYLWDRSFLAVHWLPLYLAPFTLFFCRRSVMGLGYWLFGAISFVLPGLVYFGPIFEHESFRWSFTAALGFSAALGFALGDLFESKRGWMREKLFALFLFLCAVQAAVFLMVDTAKTAWESSLPLFPGSARYRLTEKTFRLTSDDLEAAAWLRTKTAPGDRLLTNRLTQEPGGLWPDAVLGALSGAFPVGHALVPRFIKTPMGNPAYLADTLSIAFWSTGNWDLLGAEGIDWVLADVTSLSPEVRSALEGQEHQYFGDRLVARVPTFPEAGEGRVQLRVEFSPPVSGLWPALPYPLIVDYLNEGEPTKVSLDFGRTEVQPLTFLAKPGRHSEKWVIVTPYDPGEYTASLSDEKGNELADLELKVDFLERLAEVSFAADLPTLECGRSYDLKFLVSGPPLKTEGSLLVYTRFKRPGADYATPAWPRSSITLDLPQKEECSLNVVASPVPGDFELEICFFHPLTGSHVKCKGSLPVRVEP